MIRTIPKIALLVGALAMAGQASAHGGGWGGPAVLGALVGAAVVGSVVASQPREVYVQQPVYVQPQPVYAAPPPVYYAPPPRCMCSNRCITARHRSTTALRVVITVHRAATMALLTATTAAAGNRTV